MHPARGRRSSMATRNAGAQPSPKAPSGHVAALGAMSRNFFAAWRDVPKARSLTGDLLAGLTVAAVALPLNVGLAIASGLPPSAGLVAGAVGGIVAGLFGSSQF